ncbi:hypothetical protein R3P38DRAFT_3297888 [Favolaschia claudopus]|uniref:Uncharacterized protein n=1 Tax=Favolaschia claudopus TaxID=2862362 RepID=A0AAV9Z502_9AGAR
MEVWEDRYEAYTTASTRERGASLLEKAWRWCWEVRERRGQVARAPPYSSAISGGTGDPYSSPPPSSIAARSTFSISISISISVSTPIPAPSRSSTYHPHRDPPHPDPRIRIRIRTRLPPGPTWRRQPPPSRPDTTPTTKARSTAIAAAVHTHVHLTLTPPSSSSHDQPLPQLYPPPSIPSQESQTPSMLHTQHVTHYPPPAPPPDDSDERRRILNGHRQQIASQVHPHPDCTPRTPPLLTRSSASPRYVLALALHVLLLHHHSLDAEYATPAKPSPEAAPLTKTTSACNAGAPSHSPATR